MVFSPYSTATAINLGTGATNTGLHLDETELALIGEGFSEVKFGRADGTGLITLKAMHIKMTLISKVLELAVQGS